MNCTSAATVYGVNRVGGLVGAKGQSMGQCDVMSSSFTGKVIATGNYAGGIMGVGYVADSAPNSPWARIMGCFVGGSVEGKDYVGGITGGEPGVLQCWGQRRRRYQRQCVLRYTFRHRQECRRYRR